MGLAKCLTQGRGKQGNWWSKAKLGIPIAVSCLMGRLLKYIRFMPFALQVGSKFESTELLAELKKPTLSSASAEYGMRLCLPKTLSANVALNCLISIARSQRMHSDVLPTPKCG